MSGHKAAIGPTAASLIPKRTALSSCPKCQERQEKCADGRKCIGWRTSLYVCRIFGTRK